jgi:hypothetical protein
VIASDSQETRTTAKHEGIKHPKGAKLYPVALNEYGRAILGGAGSSAAIREAVCQIKSVVESKNTDSRSEFLSICQKSAKAWGVTLMIAVRTSNNLGLYVVKANGNVRTSQTYDVAGHGKDFAEFAIRQVWLTSWCASPRQKNITMKQAMRLALYTITEVTHIDNTCGRPVFVWAVTRSRNRTEHMSAADRTRWLKEIRVAKRKWRKSLIGPKDV